MEATNIGGFSQQDMITLLVASLQNQDPLNPISNENFVSQVAQLTSLQEAQSLNAKFDQFLKLQQLTEGASLLGVEVNYLGEDGQTEQAGVVRSIAAEDGQIFLEVGGERVALDRVKGIGPA